MMKGFQASLRHSPCVLLVITVIVDLAGAHKAGIYKNETAALRLRGGVGDNSHLSRIPFSSYEKEPDSSTTNLKEDNLSPSRNSTATTDTASAASQVSWVKQNTYRERGGRSDKNDVRHAFHLLSGICQGVPTDSCGDCLTTVESDWRWCSSPGLCFNTSATSTNEVDCTNFCVGDVFFRVSRSSSSSTEDDDEENEGEGEINLCSVVEDDLSLLAVVASFVVLVMCPLCLFCGCMYVAMQRCSYILNNKVHPAGSGTILAGVSTIDRQQSEFMRSRLAVAAVAEPPDASRMVTTAQAATAVPLTGLLPRAEVSPVIVGPRPCVHQAFLPSARDSVIGQAPALAPAASLDNTACSDMDRSAAGLAGLRAGVVGSSNNNYTEDSVYRTGSDSNHTTNNNMQNIGRGANIVNGSRNVGGDQDWATGSSSCAGFGTSDVGSAIGLQALGTVHAQASISASSSNAVYSNSAGHSSSDTSRGGVNGSSSNSSGSGSAHRSAHTHAHVQPHSQSQSHSSHSSVGYGNRRTINDSAGGSTTTDLAAGAGGGSAGSGGVSEPRSLFGFYSYSRVPHQDRSASHQRLARHPLFASMRATGTAARGAVGAVRAVREGAAAAAEDEEAPVLATAIVCDPLEGVEMPRGNSPSEGVSSPSTPHSQQQQQPQQHRQQLPHQQQQQDMEVSSVESSASNRASEVDGLGACAAERGAGGGGGGVTAAVSSLSSRAISSRV